MVIAVGATMPPPARAFGNDEALHAAGRRKEWGQKQ